MHFGNLSKILNKFIEHIDKTRLAKYAEQFRLGLHSESETGPLSKRKTALESEYFHKKNKEDLEKLKSKRPTAPTKPVMTQDTTTPKTADPK